MTPLEFATKIHTGEVRKYSGKPYICHCQDVYDLCVALGETDENVLAAAYLHDTLESTFEKTRSMSEVERINWGIYTVFGARVQDLVASLTFLDIGLNKSSYLDNIAKLGGDVIFIKACDRICNVRDFLESDPIYAKKYFEKANVIWEACLGGGVRFGHINTTIRFGGINVTAAELKQCLS